MYTYSLPFSNIWQNKFSFTNTIVNNKMKRSINFTIEDNTDKIVYWINLTVDVQFYQTKQLNKWKTLLTLLHRVTSCNKNHKFQLKFVRIKSQQKHSKILVNTIHNFFLFQYKSLWTTKKVKFGALFSLKFSILFSINY